MIELIANNPRRIFGLDAPPETYTTVDLDAEYTIERCNLHTACGWSPFEGMRVIGKVTGVCIRGQHAYDGKNVLVERGFGVNVWEAVQP
jgi:dihydroorotase